jgi:hypothetical protein
MCQSPKIMLCAKIEHSFRQMQIYRWSSIHARKLIFVKYPAFPKGLVTAYFRDISVLLEREWQATWHRPRSKSQGGSI